MDGDSSSAAGLERTQLVKAAGISVATFPSRILGFIRDMVLARLFGAGAAADAFFVAYRIPNLLRELFAEGSMSAAFIPVFSEYLVRRSKRDAWELASAAFTTLITILTALCLVGIVAAPWIVAAIAPGFGNDPDKQELTTLLTRIMFPYLLFIGLSALAMGVLNSIRSFAAPAFSPVMFNVGIILSALLLAPLFKEPILAVAVGVVIGGLLQFLIQLPALRKGGFLFRWRMDFGHDGVRRIGWLMAPALLGLSVTQINILVGTVLASFYPGGPTYLFYGMRLIQFPLGVFGVAVATAVLPSLATQASNGDLQALRKTLGFALRLIFFIIFPAMVGLILLRTPIVHLFFQHGQFTAADTAGTAAAVLGYAVGLWAFAGVRIIVAAFYALQDTRTPMLVAVTALLANIGLSLLLMGPMAHAGLALATALSGILNMALLVAFLANRLGDMQWKSILASHVRVVLASSPIIATCLWIAGLGVWAQPEAWIAKVVMLFVGIGISVAGYVTVHALLRSDEMEFFWVF